MLPEGPITGMGALVVVVVVVVPLAADGLEKLVCVVVAAPPLSPPPPHAASIKVMASADNIEFHFADNKNKRRASNMRAKEDIEMYSVMAGFTGHDKATRLRNEGRTKD